MGATAVFLILYFWHGEVVLKVGSIVYRYRGIFKRDPDWAVYNRYRKQYGFTG